MRLDEKALAHHVQGPGFDSPMLKKIEQIQAIDLNFTL